MRHVPRFILFFLACDFAFTFVYLINRALRQPFDTITFLVDLDGESNIPTWYSSIQLFLVALLLAIFALTKFERKNTLSWTLLAWPVIFIALSMDEIVQLHEHFGVISDILLPGGTRKNLAFHRTGIWMFLFGVPFLLFTVSLLICLKTYLSGRSDVYKVFWVALIVYTGSAVGLETLSNFLPTRGSAGAILNMLQVCAEELGEMIGATFFLWGAYKLLDSYGFSLPLHIRETASDERK